MDLPGEAWTAGAGVIATVGAVIVERLRATRKVVDLGQRIAELTATAADLQRTVAASVASIGDVSKQVAAVDSRIWSHIEHHNSWRDPWGPSIG